MVLFQIANASAIPLVTERLGQRGGGYSELIVAGLVIVPQVITAMIAPWMARLADAWGRKPLLLLAFAALALRVLLFTVAPDCFGCSRCKRSAGSTRPCSASLAH